MYWWLAAPATTAVALACLAICATTDLRRRVIPNVLVLAVTIAGLLLRVLADPGQVWISLVVWAAALVLLGVLAINALIGWGDVKLIAAVTLLVPPNAVLSLLLAIVIVGGSISAFYLFVGYLLPRATRLAPFPGRDHFEKGLSRIVARKTIPYAVAILGGFIYHAAAAAVRCWPATSC